MTNKQFRIARAKVHFVLKLLRQVRCENFTVPDQRKLAVRRKP